MLGRWIAVTLPLAMPSAALAADAAPPPPLPVMVAVPLAKHITTWDEYSGRFAAASVLVS